MIFDALDEYFEPYEPDELEGDSDYIKCSVCGLIVLRSSDLRAIENRCCLDCYYDLEEEEANEDTWY